MNPCTWQETSEISLQAISSFLNTLDKHNYRIHSLMIGRSDGVYFASAAAPYTLKTPHRLFSAAKSILVLSVLAAEDEGRLNLNDRVCDFFPEKSISNQSMYKMTVRDLLTMQTGQTDDPFPALFANFDADLIDLFFLTPLIEDPGKTFRYNNTVPHMLYALVERAVGEEFETYQNRHFCEVLDAPLLAPSNPAGQYNPVVTCLSAENFMKYALLFLRGGDWFGKRLLPKESIYKASTCQVNTKLPGNAAGYGYQIWCNAFGGYRMDGGRGQFAFILPERDVAVTVLSDMDDPSFCLKAFEKELLPGLGGGQTITYNKTVPKLRSLAPLGGVTGPDIYGQTYIFPEGRILRFDRDCNALVWTEEDIRGTRRFVAGLNGLWRENACHWLVSPVWNIDTGVYGMPMEPFLLSGAWTEPMCFECVGKSLGETGEYRYRFEFSQEKLKIMYPSKMCHGVSNLQNCLTAEGIKVP